MKKSQRKKPAQSVKECRKLMIKKLDRNFESLKQLKEKYESVIREQYRDRDQLRQQIAAERLKSEKQQLSIQELERDIEHVRKQRARLESELINNCGAVRVEYGDDDKPARVLWPVDPVTGVGTHRANAKYAAEVQERAVKAEADCKKLHDVLVKLAQVIAAISGG